MGKWKWALLFLCFAVTAAAANESVPTDEFTRMVPEKGKVKCPEVPREKYTGDTVRYHKAIEVNPWFKERLQKMEKMVDELATEMYGRPPTKIYHLGSYYCRRIRAWPNYISEHGLANALDVAGFDFGPAPKEIRSKLPKHLRGSFKVRMVKHWTARGKKTRVHAVFLQRLTKKMVDENLFRVVLGPSYPGHKDHLHVDMSPWAIVDVWEEGEEPLLE